MHKFMGYNALITFIKSSAVRFVFIMGSLVFVAVFLYWQSNNFKAIDPKPVLLHLDQKSIDRASQVEVGLEVNNFSAFSIQNNEYTLDGIVWFKFPVGQEALKTIENFTAENSLLVSGQTVYKYPPVIKLTDSHVVVSYYIILTFKSPLNYKNFPLSDHVIHIQLQHKGITPYELYYVSKQENLTLGNDLERLLADWKPVKTSVETGYKTALIGDEQLSYPTVLFSITFKKVGERDLASLYFPMLVLFLIALFSMLLDVTNLRRLQYATSAVPVLVLFRLVINGVSPRVGYITHVDYFYYILVVLSMAVIIFQIYTLFILHNIQKDEQHIPPKAVERLRRINDFAIFVILVLLVIFTIYSYFR